ncbi:MAG: ribosome small subunit-dependent GTPase A [Lachnospirales bacterium]
MNYIKGQVIKGVGGLYTVSTKEGLYNGNPRGLFRKDNIKILVGDKVDISILNEETKECVIEELFERETELIRPKIANVEQVVIVFALKEPKLNYDLLDKFIILAEEVKVDIIICINKIDLATKEEIIAFKEIYSDLYPIIEVSTINMTGLDDLKACLSNKTTVFAGPSGVGKSSIVNKIFQRDIMETGVVSKKIGRGKHTTRHSEFLEYEGGFIVDTPGFTSLEVNHLEKDNIKNYYKEFLKFQGQCKFQDCRHINEPECKVKLELGKGINEKRYNSYKQYYVE